MDHMSGRNHSVFLSYNAKGSQGLASLLHGETIALGSIEKVFIAFKNVIMNAAMTTGRDQGQTGQTTTDNGHFQSGVGEWC